jgi:lipopolysaccharide transport system permease protein
MKNINVTKQYVIEPKVNWRFINIRELFDYKDLFKYLIIRDVFAIYKQTVLGFTWAIIRPVFSMIIFTVIFGNFAKIQSDGVPYAVFSYTALIPWTYFSSALTKSTNSLITGKAIFTKVYFPRIILPLTPIFSTLIDFIISFSILVVLMIWYGIVPTINILYLPLLIILMMLTAAGIGMWLSAMAIQYRDIPHGISFLLQLLLYSAPVVWPVSLINEKYGETILLLYGLYPMAGVIEGFRSSLIGHNPMPWMLIGMGFISAILIFISGTLYFNRKERIFADVA